MITHDMIRPKFLRRPFWEVPNCGGPTKLKPGAPNDGIGNVGGGIQELLGQEDLHIVRFDVVLESQHARVGCNVEAFRYTLW